MKQRSTHKIEKDLKRELKHRAWLEKNLKGTSVLKQSRRKVLELYTEQAHIIATALMRVIWCLVRSKITAECQHLC